MDGPVEFRAGSVGLIGWTNVGKSTLLNALVGDKLAAVANVAQTTRMRIVGVRHMGSRGQIAFVDTPGLHSPRSKMNHAMLDVALQTISDVDLVLVLVDASRGVGPGDMQAMHRLRDNTVPCMIVLNKIDLVQPKSKLLPLMQQVLDESKAEAVIPVAALTGEGCDDLLEQILKSLPVSEALYPEDYLTDQTERALAAEWIREKLLSLTRQELPHATAVYIEDWTEEDDGLVRIDATILVDRSSQKQIVIGKGGSLLRDAGTAARLELEQLLGRKVYLQLWVRVQENWRNDDRILRELGLRQDER